MEQSSFLDWIFRKWRKLPPEKRFNCSEPPQESKPVWRICDRQDSTLPVRIDLAGVGKIWVKGWLAPPHPSLPRIGSVHLYFNNQLVDQCAGSLLPKNPFDLSGTIAVVSDDVGYTPDIGKLVSEKVNRTVEDILHRWLQEMDEITYEEYLSKRLCSEQFKDRVLNDTHYYDVFIKFHKIDTNQGPKNTAELISHYQETEFTIPATAGLQVRHPALPCDPREMVTDLTNSSTRHIITKVVESKGGKIEFRDVISSVRWKGAFRIQGQTDGETWLLNFFRRGFKLSRTHQDVRVALCADGRLDRNAAMVVMSKFPPRNGLSEMSDEKFIREWLRESTLLVNVGSDLAALIMKLNRENTGAIDHIPVAVHTTATLFSVMASPPQWQEWGWEHVTDLVKHFQESEYRIDELEAELARHIDPSKQKQINDLKTELAKTKMDLEKVTRELEIAKGMLGNPLGPGT